VKEASFVAEGTITLEQSGLPQNNGTGEVDLKLQMF